MILQSVLFKQNIIRDLASYILRLARSIHGDLVNDYLYHQELSEELYSNLKHISELNTYNDYIKLIYKSIDTCFTRHSHKTELIVIRKFMSIVKKELDIDSEFQKGQKLIDVFSKHVHLGQLFNVKVLNDSDAKFVESSKFKYINTLLISLWNLVYDNTFDPYYKSWWAAWILIYQVKGPVLGTSQVVHSSEASILKNSSAFLKDKMDLTNVFSRYVGIDQCFGLQNKATPEEKMQYIRDWCLNEQHLAKKSRPIDYELMRRIVNHLFTKDESAITTEQFIKGITWNISSGALFISNSCRKEIPEIYTREKMIKDLGYKVTGKKGITALINYDELIKLVYSPNIQHDVKISSAADYSKNRYIANSDIVSFIRQKLIMDKLKYRHPRDKTEDVPYFTTRNGIRIKCAFTNSIKYEVQYANMYSFDSGDSNNKAYAYVPMDYEKFDFNPTDDEVYAFVSILGEESGEKELAQLWIDSQKKGHIYLEGRDVGIYKNGILSGWYLTNMLDSLMNMYWFIYVLERTNFNFIDGSMVSVMGDDVDLRIPGQMDKNKAEMIRLFLKQFGDEYKLKLHPMKTSMRIFRSEYLKTLTGYCSQYGARGIHSLINRNEKNSTELFDALIDSKGGLYEIYSRWNNMCVRGGDVKVCDTLMLLEFEYVLGWSLGNKLSAVHRFLWMMQRDGGLGLTSDTLQVLIDKEKHLSTLTLKLPKYVQDTSSMTGLKKYLLTMMDESTVSNVIATGSITQRNGMMYKLIRQVKRLVLDLKSLTCKPVPISNVNALFMKPLKEKGNADFRDDRIILGLSTLVKMRKRGFSDAYISEYIKRNMTLSRRQIRELMMGNIKEDYIGLQLIFGIGNTSTSLLGKAKLLAEQQGVRGCNRVSGCTNYTGRLLNLLL